MVNPNFKKRLYRRKGCTQKTITVLMLIAGCLFNNRTIFRSVNIQHSSNISDERIINLKNLLNTNLSADEVRLTEELIRQASRGLDPSLPSRGLPEHVTNNLLRAQATGNDIYFDLAEADMEAHWTAYIKPNLPEGANFSYVLEIAPGHGRNTNKLAYLAEKIVGVDINPDNIKFLRKRFENNTSKVKFFQTDGVTIPREVPSGVTFIYCWDAMVHFDKEVITKYFEEFERLAVPGSYGFIHHSQVPECPATLDNGFCSNPDMIGNDPRNPHQRNANSKEAFRSMAEKTGFEVIKQVDVTWDEKFGPMDAISIVRRRHTLG